MDNNWGTFAYLFAAWPSLIDYVLVDICQDPNSLKVEVLRLVGLYHQPVLLEISLHIMSQSMVISCINQEQNQLVKYQIPREWSKEDIIKLSKAFVKDEVVTSLHNLKRVDDQLELIDKLTEIIHAT